MYTRATLASGYFQGRRVSEESPNSFQLGQSILRDGAIYYTPDKKDIIIQGGKPAVEEPTNAFQVAPASLFRSGEYFHRPDNE